LSRSWRVIAALVLALLVAPDPTGVSAAAPTIAYRFAESVSAADEAYVREGISMAAAYLDEELAGEIRDDLTVRVRNTEHPDNPYILASAGDDELVVYTGSEMWDTLSPVLRMQVVIHEYVHIYQRDMLGNGYDVSPMWFIEGMAEYVSFNALEEQGLIDPDAVDDFQTWAIAHGGDMPSLEEIEDLERFQSSEAPIYSLSHMAVVQLLDDEPAERLETYLEEIDDGAEWRDAFPEAFEIDLDDFYDEFDLWLSDEMDAPSRIPTAFREVVGRDREAAVTILSGPDEPLERGDQAIVVAETERDSNCRFDLRDEEGERVATLRTVADRTGLVFWVITIPDDAPFGRTEIVANCGGDRDRLRFDVLEG
jgi:hypothetical protein